MADKREINVYSGEKYLNIYALEEGAGKELRKGYHVTDMRMIEFVWMIVDKFDSFEAVGEQVADVEVHGQIRDQRGEIAMGGSRGSHCGRIVRLGAYRYRFPSAIWIGQVFDMAEGLMVSRTAETDARHAQWGKEFGRH